MSTFEKLLRDVPDFPKPGIIFKDITPVLADPAALKEAVQMLAEPYRNAGVDLVVGVESRGFIFGAAVAIELGVGFVPVRKPGKLPADTISVTYELEYGTDTLEIHADAIKAGQKVALIDDLIATGGTVVATRELIEKLGGEVVGASFLVELSFLNGRGKLPGIDIHSLVEVAGE